MAEDAARLLRAAIGGQLEQEVERWERVRCRALPQKDVDQIAALAASMAAGVDQMNLTVP